jgi:hypothetical protein
VVVMMLGLLALLWYENECWKAVGCGAFIGCMLIWLCCPRELR